MAADAAGGLDALLATYVPAGKPVSLAPAVLASLEQALHSREGFASYEALRQWVRQTPGVEVQDKTLDGIVRIRFRAKLQVPCPSYTKNPEAILAFQAPCRERLPHVIPSDNRRPVQVCSQDERRFGLLTVRRRRLTAWGAQPVGPIPHSVEWFYVYGAVAPTTDERFLLELPYQSMSALCGCPPYSPELSPIERVWRDVTDDVAWRQFTDVDVQQHEVGDLCCADEATALQSLTEYTYLVEAINALY